MDSLPEVVSMFVDGSSIAAWCDMDAITTVSLLSNLGIRPDMHPRVLAAIPPESLATRISSCRLDDDAAPSPAQLSHGRIMGACGSHPVRCACAEAEAWRQQELERMSGTDASQSPAKKVKIAKVAVQSNDQDVAELTQNQILECSRRRWVGPQLLRRNSRQSS